VRAEEECVQKTSELVRRIAALQVARPQRVVDRREYRVNRQIGSENQRQKRRPRKADQVKIRMDIAPSSAAARNVETAVPVDRSPQNAGVLLRQPRVERRFRHISRS
jgi:hypothetical protein